VDAASFPFSYAHASYKLQEISKWYTENLAPGAVNCPTVFSLSALEKLPAQYRKLLDSRKDAAYIVLKQAYKTADEKNIPEFKKKLTPIQYSNAELARFRAIGGKPVWDKWVSETAAKGVPAQELLNLILDTAKKASAK
jgi:TRAP-type C4-dicarboxylate transport system substrate-binding protein